GDPRLTRADSRPGLRQLPTHPRPFTSCAQRATTRSRGLTQQDLPAFEQRLEGETRSEITDQARTAYIPELMKRNPLTARAWIGMINDENLRNSLGATREIAIRHARPIHFYYLATGHGLRNNT